VSPGSCPVPLSDLDALKGEHATADEHHGKTRFL
jgi:hypothetical protein